MSSAPPSSLEPRGTDEQSSVVRAVEVVGTIFGVLGLSCLPFNFGEWITYGWPIEGSKTTPMDMWVFASTFIELGLSTLLLFSSLAAFHFKPLGRDGLILWSLSTLLYGFLGIFFWGRFFFPQINSQYAALRGPDVIAGLIAWVFGILLACVIFYHMRRPAIRAVFTGYPRA